MQPSSKSGHVWIYAKNYIQAYYMSSHMLPNLLPLPLSKCHWLKFSYIVVKRIHIKKIAFLNLRAGVLLDATDHVRCSCWTSTVFEFRALAEYSICMQEGSSQKNLNPSRNWLLLLPLSDLWTVKETSTGVCCFHSITSTLRKSWSSRRRYDAIEASISWMVNKYSTQKENAFHYVMAFSPFIKSRVFYFSELKLEQGTIASI